MHTLLEQERLKNKAFKAEVARLQVGCLHTLCEKKCWTKLIDIIGPEYVYYYGTIYIHKLMYI